MWQRWNGTSHIFEKSDDNGSTWAPLPLDAAILNQGSIPDARLSANVAMRNVGNTFAGVVSATTCRGTTTTPPPASGIGVELTYSTAVNSGVVMSYDRTAGVPKPIQVIGTTISFLTDWGIAPVLNIDTAQRVHIGAEAFNTGAKLMVAGEIMVSSNANPAPFTMPRLTLYNDTANWAFLGYGTDVGLRLIYGNSAYNCFYIIGRSSAYGGGGGVAQDARIDATGMNITGALTTGGQINTSSNIQSYGYIYPGRIDVAGVQGTWFLGSHGGYGLYCNAGFYVVGGVWATNIVLSGYVSAIGQVNSTSTMDAAQGFTGRKGSGGVTGQPFEYYWNGGGMEGYAGAAYLGLVTGLSDGRLKTNIKSVPNALEALNLLNPVTFEWIEGVGRPGTYYGLVAQEVESELPGIVEIVENLEGAPEKPLRIDYQALIPLLIRAVQELSEKIDSLES